MPQNQQLSANRQNNASNKDIAFRQKMTEFKSSMIRAFHGDENIDQFCSTLGLPPEVLKELM